jgi:hypothetical protein
MKTTDLFDDRVPQIHTKGLSLWGWSYDLQVDAGFAPEDPDHSRGFVRLEFDQTGDGCGGGIAVHLRRSAVVRDGRLKDVVELHTKGDCEAHTLGRALLFAARQLLQRTRENSEQPSPAGNEELSADGILFDSPKGSVWGEALQPLSEQAAHE